MAIHGIAMEVHGTDWRGILCKCLGITMIMSHDAMGGSAAHCHGTAAAELWYTRGLAVALQCMGVEERRCNGSTATAVHETGHA